MKVQTLIVIERNKMQVQLGQPTKRVTLLFPWFLPDWPPLSYAGPTHTFLGPQELDHTPSSSWEEEHYSLAQWHQAPRQPMDKVHTCLSHYLTPKDNPQIITRHDEFSQYHLMANNWMQRHIIKDGFQRRDSLRILNLTQRKSCLMCQQIRWISWCWNEILNIHCSSRN